MLVFIDESGDAGFKLHQGSTPFFVVSMVIFDDKHAAMTAQTKIAELRKQLRISPEFKFNKCCEDHRDAFFRGIADCVFRTRSIVVRKEIIYSEPLRNVKESFYKYFVRKMMERDGGALVNAKVVIDGSGEREFQRQLKSYIRRHIGPAAISNLELKDSTKDHLLQLADMAAGAIARSYRPDRTDSKRWRDMLSQHGQLDNVWEFR